MCVNAVAPHIELTCVALFFSFLVRPTATTTASSGQCAAESDDGTDDDILFQCPHCPDKKFRTKDALNGHMGAHNRKRKGTSRTKLCHKKKGRKGNKMQPVRHSLKDGGKVRVAGTTSIAAQKKIHLLQKALKRKEGQLEKNCIKMKTKIKVVLSA